MGEQADYLEARMWNDAWYPHGVDILFTDSTRDHNRTTLANYEWVTKSGEKVKFKDMSLRHLLNIVKIQERAGHKYAPQLRDYYKYRHTLSLRD